MDDERIIFNHSIVNIKEGILLFQTRNNVIVGMDAVASFVSVTNSKIGIRTTIIRLEYIPGQSVVQTVADSNNTELLLSRISSQNYFLLSLSLFIHYSTRLFEWSQLWQFHASSLKKFTLYNFWKTISIQCFPDQTIES